jgi:TRAP transporter 4TM/12TM fusion protein
MLKAPFSLKNSFISLYLITASLFALYTAAFGIMQPRVQRGVHLLCLVPMAFLLFPKKPNREKIPVYDWIMAFLAMLPPLYLIINHDALSMRLEFIDPLSTLEMVLGALNILLLLEAIRRAVAPAMAILVGSFVAYLYIAPYLPGVFYSKPITLSEIVEMSYLITDTGIYGSITGISATFVALFVIFGAIMESTETGKFFTDLGFRLAGKSRGGPAKVAVISSAFFGSISGVAAANVYATGTFTIPMMKRLGYRPQFAGAVEAVASSGGQYMPPIMGAGAFVMSEITGIPYLKICVAAALPALLYYTSLALRVHFVAIRDGLKGMKEGDIILPWSTIIKDSYLLIPVIGLVILLLSGYSVFMAALGAIGLSFLISFFKKKTAMTPKRTLAALRTAGENMIMVALACAGAGMVVAFVTHTGLALGVASVITSWAGGFMLPTLILFMLTSFLLGMGMPCTPAYIVAITIGGPAMTLLGFDLLATHLFIFYFAILAEVTPPVCIAAYCGASIAGSSPLQTGFEAFKLAVVAYMIPYVFIYNNSMLLRGDLLGIISLVLAMLISLVFLSAGMTGYFFKQLGVISRVIMLAVATGGIILCAHADIVGHPLMLVASSLLILAFWGFTVIRKRKERRKLGVAQSQ